MPIVTHTRIPNLATQTKHPRQPARTAQRLPDARPVCRAKSLRAAKPLVVYPRRPPSVRGPRLPPFLAKDLRNMHSNYPRCRQARTMEAS
eukprot:9856004-Alexandrium_andersonii.AAC.1